MGSRTPAAPAGMGSAQADASGAAVRMKSRRPRPEPAGRRSGARCRIDFTPRCEVKPSAGRRGARPAAAAGAEQAVGALRRAVASELEPVESGVLEMKAQPDCLPGQRRQIAPPPPGYDSAGAVGGDRVALVQRESRKASEARVQ